MLSVSSSSRLDALEYEKSSLLERWINSDNAAQADIACRYNTLVDEERMQSSCFTDPLEVFPSEISLQIITEVVIDNDRLAVDDLLSLTLVSSSWAGSIMTTPTLWTKIVVGIGLEEADSLAKLAVVLALSRDLPLSVYIPQQVRHWMAYVPVISDQAHRIARIVVFESGLDIEDDGIEFGIEELVSLGPLPNLEYFSLGTIEICGLNTPGLDQVTFLREAMTGEDFEETIRHFSKNASITIDEDAIFNMADKLHPWRMATTLQIESVLIQELSSYPYNKKSYLDGIDDMVFARLKEISVLSLTPLFVYDIILRSHNIVELSLEMSWKKLSFILPNVHLWKVLRSLTLSVNVSEDPNYVLKLPVHPSMSQLTELTIDFRGEKRRSPPAWLTMNIRTLFQLCISTFPQVYTLRISYASTGEWEHYVSSLVRLRRLFLRVSSREPTWRVFSLSLEYLFLSLDISVKFLPESAIVCPNLLRFHLGNEFDCAVVRQPEPWKENSRTRLPLNLEEEDSFRSLVALETIYPHWKLLVFNSLQRIVFGERTRSMSDFFMDIILDPLLCPSLNALGFACFPEWDWLFILLERRNYLPRTSATSRIRSIELPSCISYSLLRPLTDLVAGRLTLRPSNQELSISEIAPICFDPNLPGCMECIWSMQSCNTMPIAAVRRSLLRYPIPGTRNVHDQTQMLEVVVPVRSPPLPPGVEEWIKTRNERESKWRSQLQTWLGSFYRVDLCPARVPSRRCIITEHTLHAKSTAPRADGVVVLTHI